MKRIVELDGLRAVAILLVLGVHFPGFSQALGGLPRAGWVGVDIFFALSGYLITSVLIKLRAQGAPYRTFYARRFARILPPYLIAAVPLCIAGALLNPAMFTRLFLFKQLTFLQALNQKDVWSLLHPGVHNWRGLLLGAHHLRTAYAGINPHLYDCVGVFWSLSIEEYFYLVWAPVMLKLRRRSILIVGILAFLIEGAVRWRIGTMDAYFSIFARMDALVAGGLLAIYFWYTRDSRSAEKTARRLFVLLLVVAGLLAMILAELWPFVGRELRDSPLFLVFGLPLLSLGSTFVIGLLVLRAQSGWWFARLLRTAPFQVVGTVSYAMYVFHPIVYMGMFHLLRGLRVPVWPLSEAILDTLLTVGVAWLSWHFVEKPVLRWKDRKFPEVHTAEPRLN